MLGCGLAGNCVDAWFLCSCNTWDKSTNPNLLATYDKILGLDYPLGLAACLLVEFE